jgi:hypothetical protein
VVKRSERRAGMEGSLMSQRGFSAIRPLRASKTSRLANRSANWYMQKNSNICRIFLLVFQPLTTLPPTVIVDRRFRPGGLRRTCTAPPRPCPSAKNSLRPNLSPVRQSQPLEARVTPEDLNSNTMAKATRWPRLHEEARFMIQA